MTLDERVSIESEPKNEGTASVHVCTGPTCTTTVLKGYPIETQSKATTSFRRAVIRSCPVFSHTVVQLYDYSKTQNAHNFGHGYATDP